MYNRKTKLLVDYAQFLENVLENYGYETQTHELLEITDNNFNTVSDYLGFSYKDGRRHIKSLRICTEDVLDKILIDPNYMPVDVVYSQMPFVRPDNMIRKLALVSANTKAVAILGAYSFKKRNYEQERNQRYLQQFSDFLTNFEYLTEETAEGNLELVISRPKIKTYTK